MYRVPSARERKGYRAQRWLPFLSALLSASVTALLSWLVYSNVQILQRANLRDHVNEHLQGVRLLLDRELQSALAIPETIAAFVVGTGDIQRDVFYPVAARLVASNRHARNIALAPNNVITTIFPRSGNEAAIGLRYLDHPTQFGGVKLAMTTGKTVVSGPLPLIQGGSGIVSRTPVYVGGGSSAQYWGIVSLVLNTDSVFVSAGLGQVGGDINVAARHVDAHQQPGAVFVGDATVFEKAPVLLRYSLPGGSFWELAAAPDKGWAQGMKRAPEFIALAALFTLAIGALTYRVVASNQHIRMLATQDPLTHLPNRRLFEINLERALHDVRLHGGIGALLLLDLDRFKYINDNHGHGAGDQVLAKVAARLSACMRDSDCVARLGGDEFAVVMTEVSDEAQALHFAEQVRESIKAPIALAQGAIVDIGASIGIALFDGHTPDMQVLFNRADHEMYLQKVSHRRRANEIRQPAAERAHTHDVT